MIRPRFAIRLIYTLLVLPVIVVAQQIASWSVFDNYQSHHSGMFPPGWLGWSPLTTAPYWVLLLWLAALWFVPREWRWRGWVTSSLLAVVLVSLTVCSRYFL